MNFRIFFTSLFILFESALSGQIHMENRNDPDWQPQIIYNSLDDMIAERDRQEKRDRQKREEDEQFARWQANESQRRQEYRTMMAGQIAQMHAGIDATIAEMQKGRTSGATLEELQNQKALLEKFIQRRTEVKAQIASMDNPEIRHSLVEFGSDSMKLSREYYKSSEFEESKIASTLGFLCLEAAIALNPVASWGRDAYEAVRGKDLLTGEELDTFSHAMAILGTVTGGLGSKIGKVIKVFGRLMKGERAAEALRAGEKIVDSASHAGDKWSRTPKTLQDQMTFNAAQKGAGNPIITNLGDSRFKGMEKWEYKVKSIAGKDSVVHYVRDPETGKLMDFKFTKHSTD